MTGLFTKDNTVNQTVFVPLLMIFLLWASFSILLMDNKYHGLITFIVLAANACAFLVTVYSIKSEVMLRQYMWFWVLYAAFIGIATILNLYFNYSVIDFKYQILDDVLLKLVFSSNTNKAFSIGFANYTGIFINFSIAITSGMLMTEKKQYRSIFLLGILLLLVFTLLATGSKGGLLGLLSMSGFLLISFRRFRSKFISASIIIFLTMVISMGVISVTNKANTKGYRLGITALSKTGTGSSTNRTSSLGSRINIWRDGFSEFKRSFGIGLGAGGFTHYCEPHPHSHNYYLSILFDYGLIGLLLFAGVILAWVRLLLSLWKHQDTFLQIMVIFLSSGLVGLGVQSLVDFSYTMALSWLYFGVVIAACLLARKEFFMESKHAH
jgi:O-antigen ligase